MNLAFYIHIPYCVKRCGYCDFNTYTPAELQITSELKDISNSYIDLLISEIKSARIEVGESAVIPSIFFGGGTPSLFSPKAFDTLIKKLENTFGLDKNCEITIEANPGTFDKEHFYGYRDVGINRMSLGIQSFNQTHLKKLERIHSPKEAASAANLAVKIFDKVNIDLMFALPSQSLSDVKEDITKALEIGTSHISYYHLTIEPNTFFYKFPPQLPDEEKSAEMAEELMLEYGFSKNHIKIVQGLIRATRIPQSPKNQLERIICDSDLDYLGRNDFHEISNRLYKELKAASMVFNKTHWNKAQIKFLEAHKYHTAFAQKNRQPKKEMRIIEIKKLIVE